MAKFLDYEGLSYYTEKVRRNIASGSNANGFKNYVNLKLEDIRQFNGSKVTWSDNVATSADGHITITFNSDQTLTIVSDGNNAQLEFKLATQNTSPLPQTTLVLSGCPDTGSSETYDLRLILYIGSGVFINNYRAGTSFTYTGDNFALNIVIRANQTLNKVFKPMICHENMWAISTNYQPYALSNVQITDFIQTPANTTDIDNIWDNT